MMFIFISFIHFFKEVNWKCNPGVKYYKFQMVYTKLVQL